MGPAQPSTEFGIHTTCVEVGVEGFPSVLVDMGSGAIPASVEFMKRNVHEFDIFQTHLHMDHFLGVFGLLETLRLNGRTEKLTIYAPRGAEGVFGRKDFLEIREIDEKWSEDFGSFSVGAFATKHAGTSFGFLISEKEKVRFHEEKAKGLGLAGPMFSEIQKKGSLKVNGKTIKLKDVTYVSPGKTIVYSGDSAPCATLTRAAKGADLLIHESTFGSDKVAEAKDTSHSTAEDAATCAKKAGAKRLILTHFSGRYADTSPLVAEAKKIFPNVEAAKDGMKIEV